MNSEALRVFLSDRQLDVTVGLAAPGGLVFYPKNEVELGRAIMRAIIEERAVARAK